MKRIAIAAACLLALQSEAGLAQPTDPPPPPAEPPIRSEALVERFLAAVPRETWLPGPADEDPGMLDRLVRQKPAEAARIALILRDFRKCAEPPVAAFKDLIYRMTALSPLLDPEKIERLTALFSGPDWPRLRAVAKRIEASATPAAADIAEKDRLMAAYPVALLSRVLNRAAFAALTGGALNGVRKCEGERNSALARVGVRPPPGSAADP